MSYIKTICVEWLLKNVNVNTQDKLGLNLQPQSSTQRLPETPLLPREGGSNSC